MVILTLKDTLLFLEVRRQSRGMSDLLTFFVSCREKVGKRHSSCTVSQLSLQWACPVVQGCFYPGENPAIFQRLVDNNPSCRSACQAYFAGWKSDSVLWSQAALYYVAVPPHFFYEQMNKYLILLLPSWYVPFGFAVLVWVRQKGALEYFKQAFPVTIAVFWKISVIGQSGSL